MAQDVAHYVGTNSCAAASCHGGARQGPRWTTSYSEWVQRDRHAHAYTVLLGMRSQRMARALNLKQPAHRSAICLNCHALPPTPGGGTTHHAKLATDGVSCEACHGPASLWIDRHMRADWGRVTPAERHALHFFDTGDVAVRTRACAGCHVGGPGRDVNHDLIAAGHPRLNFEMAAYHANMAHHWDDQSDEKRHSGRVVSDGQSLRELKLWAVGQVETLRARVELSRWRASTAEAPWPELAETRCFACHHDLRDASWRRGGARNPGQLPWATWERAMSSAVAVIGPADERVGLALGAVDKVTRAVAPDRKTMIAATGKLAASLEAWSASLNSVELTLDDLESVTRQLASATLKDSPRDWDQAAQLYLALSSLQVARQKATGLTSERDRQIDQALQEALPKMRGTLRFPVGLDSAGQLRNPVAKPAGIPAALRQFDAAARAVHTAVMNNEGARR